MEEHLYFSIEQFNEELWENLDKLNHEPFKNKEHNPVLLLGRGKD